ncbi:AroM family protein [Youngiibacter fragilis]|uniref:AroM n=1 Tax=Youngiibacter fragilis 232.1 TaxID=994573 RepID=V7I533_9CLOT|nr:AroM family protein [Youngiibacter fragilis]ETA80077.1 AroM [Youngiibacter fragilis 232.1]
MKVGAITVGQSPRVDVTPDLLPIFGDKVELIEIGALDGLSYEEIAEFAPVDGDYVLVSRMKDGGSVTFAEKHILPRLQECIFKLEEQGVSLIIFFCTGNFPVEFDSKVPLIFPNMVLGNIVPLLTRKKSISVLIPSELQITQAHERWEKLVDKVTVFAASPYGKFEDVRLVAEKLTETDSDLVVLDCIGYTQEMKDMVYNLTKKPVVLPRTLAARIVTEMADIG